MENHEGNHGRTKAQKLAFTVVQAGRAGLNVVEARALRPLGLSYSGSRTLNMLWLLGPHEPRELAGALGISVPSVTSLLNTLERRGLVNRQRSATDGRLVIVSITDSGLELAAAAHSEALRVEVVAASALSPDERDRMQDYLDRYLAAIEEHYVGLGNGAGKNNEYNFPSLMPELAESYLSAAEGNAPRNADEAAALWESRHAARVEMRNAPDGADVSKATRPARTGLTRERVTRHENHQTPLDTVDL